MRYEYFKLLFKLSPAISLAVFVKIFDIDAGQWLGVCSKADFLLFRLKNRYTLGNE